MNGRAGTCRHGETCLRNPSHAAVGHTGWGGEMQLGSCLETRVLGPDEPWRGLGRDHRNGDGEAMTALICGEEERGDGTD